MIYDNVKILVILDYRNVMHVQTKKTNTIILLLR